MSRYDYEKSKELADAPFYSLIMAAMRRADTNNAEALKDAFPETWAELKGRYNAPGGCLTDAEFMQMAQKYEAENSEKKEE